MAESLWNDPDDAQFAKRHDPAQGMAVTDLEKFERLGRTDTHTMPFA